MKFTPDKPIYRQIIDYAFAAIQSGKWKPGDKIPSVRELAAQMDVNAHTVLKAYDYLTAHGIISVKRGMGYFLSDKALHKVNAERCEYFFDHTLQEMFRQMTLLDIDISDVIQQYYAYRNRLLKQKLKK
ncbi:MAG: GntR family transcriptional regulator [Muribaculaceae bacterium]|nr:GntR family transcriptional regulator [Muribaculaceae bacterium]